MYVFDSFRQVEAQLLATDDKFLRLHGVPAGRALDLFGRTLGGVAAEMQEAPHSGRRQVATLPTSASALRYITSRSYISVAMLLMQSARLLCITLYCRSIAGTGILAIAGTGILVQARHPLCTGCGRWQAGCRRQHRRGQPASVESCGSSSSRWRGWRR